MAFEEGEIWDIQTRKRHTGSDASFFRWCQAAVMVASGVSLAALAITIYSSMGSL